MSQRHVTTGFVDRLRKIEERLRNLEGSKSTAVKQNDIRLSDTLVRADSPNDRLCLENLVTKQIVCIGAQTEGGDPAPALWSFSGEMTGDNVGDISPAWFADRECTARQILVGQPCDGVFGGGEDNILLCVQFCDAGVQVLMNLLGNESFTTTEVNVPMVENDRIVIEVINAASPPAKDISVIVKFGTPTVNLSTGNGCAS